MVQNCRHGPGEQEETNPGFLCAQGAHHLTVCPERARELVEAERIGKEERRHVPVTIVTASISWAQKNVFRVFNTVLASGKSLVSVIFYLLGSYVIIPTQRMSKSRLRRALCYQELAGHAHPGLSAHGSDAQHLCCDVRLLECPPVQARMKKWFLGVGPWVDGCGGPNSEMALKVSRVWCACPAKSPLPECEFDGCHSCDSVANQLTLSSS